MADPAIKVPYTKDPVIFDEGARWTGLSPEVEAN